MSTIQHLNLAPGMHFDIPEEKYHADLLMAKPTLSRSEAVKLLEESPLHLWCAHPRLGAKNFRPVSNKMDFGAAGHAMILGTGSEVVVVDAEDWKTKAAREQRDAIRESGNTPLLKDDHERAVRVRDAFFIRLGEFGLREKFEAGRSEVTLLTDEGSGAFCRVRLDRLTIMETEGKAIIFDPKLCESANPSHLPRQVINMGYVVQEAYYTQALQHVRPDLAGRIRFVYLFQETEFPFAMTPVELNGEFKCIGVSKICRAVDAWKKCLADGRWPGYTKEIITLEPPAWALNAEMGATSIR
jgi:hypothetical protein